METWLIVLIGWLVFVACIYVWAMWDAYYYSHDVKGAMKKLKETFTEE